TFTSGVFAASAFAKSILTASDVMASPLAISVFTKSFAGSLRGSLATDEIAAGLGSLGAMAAGFSGADGTAGVATTAATAGAVPCAAGGSAAANGVEGDGA